MIRSDRIDVGSVDSALESFEKWVDANSVSLTLRHIGLPFNGTWTARLERVEGRRVFALENGARSLADALVGLWEKRSEIWAVK